ncbi:MAG: hypothetical protein RL514_2573 [Verrucomicrobiota bacterium]|jgi:transglutaminase-like putative cysteine protease
MKPPPFLLAFALLLWGWQTSLLPIALLLAVVLEAARWIEWRLEFDVPDFNRIADLCTVLAAVAMVYCILTRETGNQVMEFFQTTSLSGREQAMKGVSQTTFVFLQWLPMLIFPAVAALAYSAREQVPLSCFSFFQRRRYARAKQPQPLTPAFHLGYPYLAVVLFSAAMANQRTPWFYFAVCAAVAWGLWPLRPRRFSNVIWVCVLIGVTKAGYLGHKGLSELQSQVEGKILSWMSNWARRSLDRTESSTAIGRIGQLKLSGKIVLRVEREAGPVPPLLRDASFSRFESPRWFNPPRIAEAKVEISGGSTTFPLLKKVATNAVLISSFAARGQAVLALPPGTATLENLLANEVFTNRVGVVRVTGVPDFLQVRALHGPGLTLGEEPWPAEQGKSAPDLAVPLSEQPAVKRIADELALAGQADHEVARRVQRFFAEEFKYGSFLPSSLTQVPQGMTPLSFFLLKNRVGHCEYYATATVLLLRQAGISARYIYGWSVQEPETNSNAYVVRERHAHAWCVYWNAANKSWVDLDTTPSNWVGTENENASFLEPLTDRWSRAWFGFSRWRVYGGADAWQGYLLGALLLLLALLAWRVLARQRRRRKAEVAGIEEWLHRPGTDSEFYRIEVRLEELGLGRRAGETLADWLARIEPLAKLPVTPLRQLLALHYRLRFDPLGLSGPERTALRSGVGEWLAKAKAA